jgi:nucleoside-diphosphate-sugar epimerase
MRVFLTGGSGNVGRAVLSELLRRGHEVIALVRRELPDIAGYRPVMGDLARIKDVAAEVAMTDAIIHCATPRSLRRAQVLQEDVEATGVLLDAWSRGSFVYMSSQTVYGVPRGVLEETSPLAPANWYDLGKICNEHQLAIASARPRRTGVALRLPLVFAAGPRRRDRQFLPLIHEALHQGRTFLFGSEEAIASHGTVFIGEADLGRAVTDALSLSESGPYNLASGFCTWHELVTCMGRQCSIEPRFAVRATAAPSQNEFRLPQSRSFFDCTRFTRLARFAPQQALEELIGGFVAAEHSGAA